MADATITHYADLATALSVGPETFKLSTITESGEPGQRSTLTTGSLNVSLPTENLADLRDLIDQHAARIAPPTVKAAGVMPVNATSETLDYRAHADATAAMFDGTALAEHQRTGGYTVPAAAAGHPDNDEPAPGFTKWDTLDDVLPGLYRDKRGDLWLVSRIRGPQCLTDGLGSKDAEYRAERSRLTEQTPTAAHGPFQRVRMVAA